MFLFAYLFNCGLFHCRHSCIAILVSGKGCHCQSVIGIIRKQLIEIAELKKLTFWSSKLKCWSCYNVDFGWSSDWMFECAVFGVLSPTSDHFLHGVTYFDEGEPICVNNSRTSLFKAFETGISRENFNVNFAQKRAEKWTGYCLTNDDIVKYWSETVFKKELKKRLVRIKESNWQRRSYRVKKRREIANWLSVPVMYAKHAYIYKLKTELFHAFDTWQGTLFRYMIYFTHVSCEWSIRDTQKCVDEISVGYLSKQVNSWLNTVGSRDLKKTLLLRTDGTGYKKICESLPLALWRGMWLCYDIEEPIVQDYMRNGEEIDVSIFFPTLVFSSLWAIHYHSRRMWACMWKTFIKCPSDGSEPVEITQMYSNAESAGINIYNYTPGMVCCLNNCDSFVNVYVHFVNLTNNCDSLVNVYVQFVNLTNNCDSFINVYVHFVHNICSFVLTFGEHFVQQLMNFIII